MKKKDIFLNLALIILLLFNYIIKTNKYFIFPVDLLYCFQVVLLYIGLNFKKRRVNISAILLFILYIISYNSNYIYIDTIYYTSLVSFIFFYVIEFLFYKEYRFSNNLVHFLKTSFISASLFLLGLAIIAFSYILDFDKSFYQMFYIINFFISAFIWNVISSDVESKEKTILWIDKFVNKILVWVSFVWMGLLDLTSLLVFINVDSNTNYFLQLFGFIFIIILNLFISIYLEESKISVWHRRFSLLQPFMLSFLILKFHNTISHTFIYSIIFLSAYLLFYFGKVKLKTLALFTILIYFAPIVGFASNPFKIANDRNKTIQFILTEIDTSFYFEKEESSIKYLDNSTKKEFVYLDLDNKEYKYKNLIIKMKDKSIILDDKNFHHEIKINSDDKIDIKPIVKNDKVIYINSISIKDSKIASVELEIIK